MAVNANCYFSNAIVGVPQVAAGQVNVYKEDTTARFAIGTKFERQDGAVFRYAHFGATVDSAGLLCSVDVSESSTTLKPGVVVASSSTYQMPEETTGVYPNMLGSKYMLITLASVQTDTYAGGYITISSGNSASSHTYRIKGNTATGNPDSGNTRIELYEKLQAGLNSSQGFTITGSRYANLEANLPATGTDLAAGVTMISITTANDYGWVQTQGICGVLAGETTILAGRMVSASTEVAGAVDLYNINVQSLTSTAYAVAPVNPIVGIACQNSTAGTFIPIVLMLE